MPQQNAVVRVGFGAPARRLFDYLPPRGVCASSIVGRRALAPFGGREAAGVILAAAPSSAIDAARLKRLRRVYDDMPPLPPPLLEMIFFCASYYHCSAGAAAACALPTLFRRKSESRPAMVFLLCASESEIDSALPPRQKTARQVARALAQGDKTAAELVNACGAGARRALKELLQKKFIAEKNAPYFPPLDLESDSDFHSPAAAPALNEEQKAAVRAAEDDRPLLLMGATGSGKTEVYLHRAAAALAAGRRVLALTPEINLTPQLAERFARRFGARRLAVLHSGMADGARARGWTAAARGEVDIVVGTRLAVFAPLPNLGLIVVDEEHDDSFRQREGVCFSARDLAVWRARREKAKLILGSATPALESYQNAQSGRYALARMKRRARGGAPAVRLLPESGENYHGMGAPFVDAVRACLQSGGQALVFINRRGFSPALYCPQCAQAAACGRCSVNLVYHRRVRELRCHWCGRHSANYGQCPKCGADAVPLGGGAQRIEEALTAALRGARVLRLDRDSLSRRGSFGAARKSIAAGEFNLLVGTQIIAKGHDFPDLRLVAVLGADNALYAADFRAAERLFALLTQVAGRGTRARRCEVVLQTATPHHPLYEALRRDDVQAFWQTLLNERKAAGLPPFSAQLLLRAEHAEEKRAIQFLQKAAALLAPPRGVRLFSPTPAPAARVAGVSRCHLLAQCGDRALLRRFGEAWADALEKTPPRGVRWRLESDPADP